MTTNNARLMQRLLSRLPRPTEAAAVTAVTVMLGAGCHADPPISSDVRADEELVDAIRQTLDAPETPEDGLRSFQARVGEVLRDHDAEQARLIAAASLLAAIETEQDLQALETLTGRVDGRTYEALAETSTPGDAQPRELWTAVCPDAGEDDVVYYVNGVLNTVFDALASTEALAKHVKTLDASFEGSFRLFYNASGAGAHEMACNQIGLLLTEEGLPDEDVVHVRALAQAHCSDVGLAADLGEVIAQLIGFMMDREPELALVEKLRDITVADVMGGKKVVVVAHSQGNLFARGLAALLADLEVPPDQLSPAQSIGIVSTASPVSFGAELRATLGDFEVVQVKGDFITSIPGSPAWTTSNAHSRAVDAALANAAEDPLVVAARLLRHGWSVGLVIQLASLFARYAPVTVASYHAHSFGTSYLGPETGPVVAHAVVDMSASLTNARPLAGQGELQVMLLWDTPGDIDLHVDEPDGTHVFWAARQGTTGELDRDDIVGRGPENFYVCDRGSVALGEYTVSVNNFGGRAGTVADVYVRAGDELRRLTTSVGPADGGATLIEVATISFDGESFEIAAQ